MSQYNSTLVSLGFTVTFGMCCALAAGCGGADHPAVAPPPPAGTTPCPVVTSAPVPSAVTPEQLMPGVASVAAPLTGGLTVTVKNPLTVARAAQTISVHLADAQKLLPTLQVAKAIVQGPSGAAVLSQLVDTDGDGKADELVFQTDFAASETKTYLLGEGARSTPTHEQYKVYGRFARERHDDFAWENDRTAHRMYGPDLETFKADPLTSSGIDVWVKRTPRLVVNEWYQSDDYHHDNGDGADFYSVGPSRGCGGIGFWDGKALHVSRNFTTTRVLANGPIRLIFELSYAPWDAGGGLKVSETKRITVDAGQHFDHFESTFKVTGKGKPLTLAIGIAKHPDSTFDTDQANGTLRSWEKFTGDNGHLGCALVNVAGPAAGFAEIATDRLLLSTVPAAASVTYLAGTGWDKGAGDVPDAAAWAALVNTAASEAKAPLAVSLAVR